MPRPAPSVERTVRLLKFLADNPRERFTLSEIARRLDFNKATCHAMLSELVDQGMLIRHPADKSYLLGPALVNLGMAAALDATEALDIARGEMDAIHEELDVSCLATALVEGDIVIMARRDVERPLFGYSPTGSHSPFVPPYGTEFVAWAHEDSVEAWLDRHTPALTPGQREGYYRVLEHVRLRGYDATPVEQVMALRRLLQLMAGLPGVTELDNAIAERAEARYAGTGLGDETLASVTAIKAPVFGPSGDVVLCLSIGQFAGDIERDDVQGYAERLVEGTRRVTAALHGSEPSPPPVGETVGRAG